MFNNDLLLSFAFMALLFIRQIVILKRPNKINYAPLMLGIGAIATLVHFIIYPETHDPILLARESLFPFLVALLLYIVMNIMHQTQLSENARTQEEFAKILVNELSELKSFILEIEEKMNRSQKAERISQEEIRIKFKEDIKALDSIQSNQEQFLEKFDAMESWHENVSKGFENFTEVQLPELDNVVHKHIDILRVSEQDHYNKLSALLQRAVESRGDMSNDLDNLKANINSIKTISDEIATQITTQALHQLSGVTKAFESQLISLKSHTEGIRTSLYEGENRLDAIRAQSELLLNQMVLSSNKMQELLQQNSSLEDIYLPLNSIIKDVEIVKSEYIKSQSQLSLIASEFTKDKDEHILDLQKKIELLAKELNEKIDNSLKKLHEHYHITDGELSQSVQLLAKQAQVKSGY
jgi:hypothetical protein